MLQTFDRSVPLPEQRFRVACKKAKRLHPKRHSTAPERIAKAKKQAGARKSGRIKQAIKAKGSRAWSKWYWGGEWL